MIRLSRNQERYLNLKSLPVTKRNIARNKKREEMTLPEYDPSIFSQDLPELSFLFLDSGNVAIQETN